jgi:hypothetical protein
MHISFCRSFGMHEHGKVAGWTLKNEVLEKKILVLLAEELSFDLMKFHEKSMPLYFCFSY